MQEGKDFLDVVANIYDSHFAIDKNFVRIADADQPAIWLFGIAAPVFEDFTCLEQKSVFPPPYQFRKHKMVFIL